MEKKIPKKNENSNFHPPGDREEDHFSSIPITPVEKPEGKRRAGDASSAAAPLFPRRQIRKKRESATKTRLFFLCAALIISIYSASGIFVPYIIKTYGADALSSRLGRHVTIGQASFNPLKFKITLINGIVGPITADPSDKVDPVLSFSSLTMNFAAASLANRAFILKELSGNQIFINLVRYPNGENNLAVMYETLKKSISPQTRKIIKRAQKYLHARYSLNNIIIKNSEISLIDISSSATHEIKDLNLYMPVIANINYQDSQLLPNFSATINGSKILLTGQAHRNAGRLSSMAVKVDDLDLASYASYLPLKIDRQKIKGRADLNLQVIYDAKSENPEDSLKFSGDLKLNQVELTDNNGRISKLKSGTIKGTYLPIANKIQYKEIILNQPQLSMGNTPQQKLIFSTAGLSMDLSRNPFTDKPPTHILINQGEFKIYNSSSRNESIWQEVHASLDFTNSETTATSAHSGIVSISAKGPENARINIQANFSPEPFSIKGLFVANQLNLDQLMPTLGLSAPSAISDSPLARFEAKFDFEKGKNNQNKISLENILIQANDLKIEKEGKTIVEIAKLESKNGYFSNTEPPVLRLGSVVIDNADFNLASGNSSGSWRNFLFPDKKLSEILGADMECSHVRFTDTDISIINSSPESQKIFSLERLNLNIEKQKADLQYSLSGEAKINGQANLKTTGSFVSSPGEILLNIDIADMPSNFLSPLFSDQDIPDGSISAAGELRIPDLFYLGSIIISDMTGNDILDSKWSKAISHDFLFSSSPYEVKFGTLEIDRPEISISHTSQAETQSDILSALENLIPGKPENLAIDKIAFHNGKLNFKSAELSPELTVTISQASGQFENINTKKDTPIKFLLNGIAETARVEISGKAWQDNQDNYQLEISNKISDLPAKKLAPYLEKYLGHEITNGNLDFLTKLNLHEHWTGSTDITAKDLHIGGPKGQNSMCLEGWRNLPLLHGLIQDNSGKINIKVPITAAKNSLIKTPGFKKFFIGLLLKAAVSPFVLLDNDHSSEKLSGSLKFIPGSHEISVAGQQMLHKLSTILQDRPSLLLVITGSADLKSDYQALVDKQIEEVRKRQSRHDAVLSDKISYAYGSEEIIEQAGDKTHRDFADSSPDKIKIPDRLLLDIAERRSSSVRNFLIKNGLNETRIKVKKDELINPNLGRSGNRVELNLEVK